MRVNQEVPGPDDPRREAVEPLAITLSLTSPSLSRMAYRFYAAMFLYQDYAPFSAKLLCELLEVSSASASISLRALESEGLIFRTRPTGERVDVYDLVDETQYGQNYARRYLSMIPQTEESLKALEPGSKAWLRVKSVIDLWEVLARDVPEVFIKWQRERAHLYGR